MAAKVLDAVRESSYHLSMVRDMSHPSNAFGAQTSVNANVLAQHILTLEPDKDAARLCFYHFLKNLCEPTEVVNHDLINRFYRRALGFAHWQDNQASLFNETEALLSHFQESTLNELKLTGTLRSGDIQVIRAQNLHDVEIVVEKSISSTVRPTDQFRIIREGDVRIIAIVLMADRSLRVTTYNRALALRDGELAPLHHDHTLIYTHDLQLHPMMIQTVEIGPHAIARFHTGVEGLRGSFVRGYSFQKYASLDGGGLNRYPLLFYPLKRLEQFFVDRKTDPVYVELTNNLEKALDLLSSGHPDGMRFANAALERGRLALEHIFPDDRLARLLITNLEKSLALTGRSNDNLARRIEAEKAKSALAQSQAPRAQSFDLEPQGRDLLEKDEDSWPEIKNLPV